MWSHILAIISLWNCFGTGHFWEAEEVSQHLHSVHNHQHHRSKRFLWMTHEKRLVFPPGTQLVLTPTVAMPLLRYPPHGLDANFTISTPFTSKYQIIEIESLFPKVAKSRFKILNLCGLTFFFF